MTFSMKTLGRITIGKNGTQQNDIQHIFTQQNDIQQKCIWNDTEQDTHYNDIQQKTQHNDIQL